MTDFRNYREMQIRPGLRANAFLGPNGTGKTNILEALHLVSTGLSHRAASDREMIRHGATAFAVRAAVVRDEFPDAPVSQQIIYSAGRKSVRRGQQVMSGRGRTEVLGSAVVFSPDDLSLIKGPPAGRRAFLDLTLAKGDGRYRTCARRYQSALAQRNRLLSSAGYQHVEKSLLEPWTEQLIELGARLLDYRLRGMALVTPGAVQAYSVLAGATGERLALEYVHAVPPESDLTASTPPPGRAALEAYLRRSFAETARDERLRGATLAGPHRDDIQLLLDDVPIRVYGSQGQQRSAALALRLGEMGFLHQVLQERPLLLLDDVFSELDQARRRALLELLSLGRSKHQTFMTATDLLGLPSLAGVDLMTFEVRDGSVTHVVPA